VTVSGVVSVTEKLTWPELFVTQGLAWQVMLDDVPELPASVTALPASRVPEESFSVTVIVELATPSATAEDGLAAVVEELAMPAGTPKVTVLELAEVVPLAGSLATYVTASGMVSVARKNASPRRFVVEDAGVTTECVPVLPARVTCWPGKKLPPLSATWTTANAADNPSAGTEAGLALTEMNPGAVGTGVKLTNAVCATSTPSVTSVATSVADPTAKLLTLK